jgi:ferritin-like protein
VRQLLSSSVGEIGDAGDREESRDTDVTELFDLSTCQWLPLPSVSSDPSEISAMIPLSEIKT